MKQTEVSRLKDEMKQLERKLEQVKQTIERLQSECEHQFEHQNMMKKCSKCEYTDVTYY